jgi:hypothetical protein
MATFVWNAMSHIARFSVGCAVGALLLVVGQQLGQVAVLSNGAAAVVLLSGLVVAVANTPRSRVGRAAAQGCVLLFFSLIFFELAHRLNVSSFDPTPVYGVVVLLLSVVIGAMAYVTASAAGPQR